MDARSHILFPLRSQRHTLHLCETKGEMSHSTCGQCGEIMTGDTKVKKSVSKKGKQYYMSRCRTCIDESETILRRLKKENPQPPAGTPCACCKRIDKLFLDHVGAEILEVTNSLFTCRGKRAQQVDQ